MSSKLTIAGLIVAFTLIMGAALFFGLVSALHAHPWLIIFVILAAVVYVQAKKAERRERGDN